MPPRIMASTSGGAGNPPTREVPEHPQDDHRGRTEGRVPDRGRTSDPDDHDDGGQVTVPQPADHPVPGILTDRVNSSRRLPSLDTGTSSSLDDPFILFQGLPAASPKWLGLPPGFHVLTIVKMPKPPPATASSDSLIASEGQLAAPHAEP